MTQLNSGPPVPPPSYWPDRGEQQQPPPSSKPPTWAKAILAGAAAVAVLGGGLIAVRNLGAETVTPPPSLTLPTLKKFPTPTAESSAGPEPTESATETSTTGTDETPAPTSTFPVLKAVPEICDILPLALTKRLAPRSESEPGSSRDGYGALRKDCNWNQRGKNMKGTVLESRSIMVKVAVFPTVADAREDFDFSHGSMEDLAGTKEENPGLKYLSTYGEMKAIEGLGDQAAAMYTSNLKGTTNAWCDIIVGNATLHVRLFGTDNTNGDILADGDDTKPVAEAELMKGVEEVARAAVDALVK
ncbi:hypothetical protein OIE66_11995 [Nonomuraea sp. NBC_01738]|uniref:hypothetical protein n=1 Tax=Nonomuraea sp. NBC_01738 TaxID=2976003 RepID=UPI002E0F7870|nr:hypothetical protein OIE66_11995 [Nonomuraea sp. NBC_01738]